MEEQFAEIETSKSDETFTVIGRGDLDLDIVKELNMAIRDAMKSGKDVAVDFRDARYIDSAILESLVGTGKKLMTAGKRMKVIIDPSGQPAYALDILGLHSLLDVVAASDSTEGS